MRSGARALVRDYVRVRVEHDLAAWACVQSQRDLIAHRAGRHEQRGLVSEHLRNARFERIDRRVLAVNVVTDFGIGHRGPHASRGSSQGVRAKVNPHHSSTPSCAKSHRFESSPYP